MALPEIPIERDGGSVSVEVFVGQAHFGTYHLWLWNAEGTTKTDVGDGINSDDRPDVVELDGDANELDRRILHWKIRVSTIGQASPGSQYSVFVTARQGGKPVWGHTWSGAMGDNPIEIEGGARLVL